MLIQLTKYGKEKGPLIYVNPSIISYITTSNIFNPYEGGQTEVATKIIFSDVHSIYVVETPSEINNLLTR